jgi:hypothetical protein
MGKARTPPPPIMRLSGGVAAKCSDRWGSRRRRNSVPKICILQMQIDLQHLLETVLCPSGAS